MQHLKLKYESVRSVHKEKSVGVVADSKKMLWSKFTTDFGEHLFEGGKLDPDGTCISGNYVCVCEDTSQSRRLRVFNTALTDTQPVLSVDDIHIG